MKLNELLKERLGSKASRIQLRNLTKMSEQEMPRQNELIEAGGYKLSIQCSYGHYCTPRITADYSSYETMELAVIGECDFISIHLEKQELQFLEQYFDGAVYGYVPVTLLEKMIAILKEELHE